MMRKGMSTGSRLELEPTMAHHVLAALEEKGLIGMLGGFRDAFNMS